MIRTDVPMIDVFNCLIESRKIPIFSTASEPFNAFMASIGIQADADIIVFGGVGLVLDDYWFCRKRFEDAGMFSRAVTIVSKASGPVIERLLVPDMSLAIAERFTVDDKKRVLVLLTDMTGYADALKEVRIGMEQLPSNRGYEGDLCSQMARRYEKACDFKGGEPVTILWVVTMPKGRRHPSGPGQHGLHQRRPFLPQGRPGRALRLALQAEAAGHRQTPPRRPWCGHEHHDPAVLGARDAAQKKATAFDLGWQTLAECFSPGELLMKDEQIERYHPADVRARHAAA